MAVSTPCQTSGAQFHIKITETGIAATVDFNRVIHLTEEQAEALDGTLHNVLELALAPLFVSAPTTVCDQPWRHR